MLCLSGGATYKLISLNLFIDSLLSNSDSVWEVPSKAHTYILCPAYILNYHTLEASQLDTITCLHISQCAPLLCHWRIPAGIPDGDYQQDYIIKLLNLDILCLTVNTWFCYRNKVTSWENKSFIAFVWPNVNLLDLPPEFLIPKAFCFLTVTFSLYFLSCLEFLFGV